MHKGQSGFEEHYGAQFGARWTDLRAALLYPPGHMELREGLQRSYFLDPASFAVASLLPLAGAATILDLCAAPGGKSLVLATRMEATAQLVCNERSNERRARLHRVLEEHLPPELRARSRVTAHDARRWGLFEPDRYDAVLADVPCSSERHVLTSPGHLKQWSETRIKRLAVEQFAILAAAVDSARAGGFILYATCALSDAENDAVVARALARRADRVEAVALDAHALEAYGVAGAEPTAHGLRILPDSATGAGPMYCALLRRRGTRTEGGV